MVLINEDVSQHIGHEIKKRRKSLHISGAELAKKLGVSQQQISRYERGVNQPSLTMMMRLFLSLGMSEYEIKQFFEPLITLYKTLDSDYCLTPTPKRESSEVLLSGLTAEHGCFENIKTKPSIHKEMVLLIPENI
ncbi:MAG: putative HTH-type transcriptional regulator [Candidatus Erwinia impunctatus]|nr:putative HTH-type transcriptional regulator [Culicoides impunctatus]